MKLYEIDRELEAAIEAAFDPETGEILDDAAFERMNELEMAREAKLEGVALWIKGLIAEAEAINNEKNNLAKREKVLKNKAERLKQWLSYVLNGEKLKTPRVAISWRSSETVEFDDTVDPEKLPPRFIKPQPAEINKTAVKAALMRGEDVPGFWLEKHQNIQIR